MVNAVTYVHVRTAHNRLDSRNNTNIHTLKYTYLLYIHVNLNMYKSMNVKALFSRVIVYAWSCEGPTCYTQTYMYMETHVHSTLAKAEVGRKEGNPDYHVHVITEFNIHKQNVARTQLVCKLAP